jgi:hypothetical protein
MIWQRAAAAELHHAREDFMIASSSATAGELEHRLARETPRFSVARLWRAV